MSEQQDFKGLGIAPELVQALARKGYRTAMPIQSAVVPLALSGRDVLIHAKTGSGKTLAYGLPLLQANPRQERHPERLVVTPTRELARQVETELAWAGELLGRTIVGLYGGGRLEKQIAQLQKGADAIVATPGRLLELLRDGIFSLSQCRFIVLDEVDELLQRGFGPDIAEIFALLPKARQVVFCSATVPVEVETLVKGFGRSPQRVALTVGRDLPTEVEHRVVYTTIDDREKDLAAWLRLERPYQCIVFTGSRQEAESVATALAVDEFDVEVFHGDLSPNKRKRLIERFRSGDLPVLVATDIVARGMDLPGVTHVVNHSLPKAIGAYIHRTGRTGRAGRQGMAVSFVIPQEVDRLERLREVFAFQAVTVKGSHAGEVRPLKTAKLHLTRAERRGVQRDTVPVTDATARKPAAVRAKISSGSPAKSPAAPVRGKGKPALAAKPAAPPTRGAAPATPAAGPTRGAAATKPAAGQARSSGVAKAKPIGANPGNRSASAPTAGKGRSAGQGPAKPANRPPAKPARGGSAGGPGRREDAGTKGRPKRR